MFEQGASIGVADQRQALGQSSCSMSVLKRPVVLVLSSTFGGFDLALRKKLEPNLTAAGIWIRFDPDVGGIHPPTTFWESRGSL